jgi:hypothetical protein
LPRAPHSPPHPAPTFLGDGHSPTQLRAAVGSQATPCTETSSMAVSGTTAKGRSAARDSMGICEQSGCGWEALAGAAALQRFGQTSSTLTASSESMVRASLRSTQRDGAYPLYGAPRCRSGRCRVTVPHRAFFNVHLLRSGQMSLVAGTKMRLRHALATSDAGKGAQGKAVSGFQWISVESV